MPSNSFRSFFGHSWSRSWDIPCLLLPIHVFCYRSPSTASLRLCAPQIFSDSCLGMFKVYTVQFSKICAQKWTCTSLDTGTKSDTFCAWAYDLVHSRSLQIRVLGCWKHPQFKFQVIWTRIGKVENSHLVPYLGKTLHMLVLGNQTLCTPNLFRTLFYYVWSMDGLIFRNLCTEMKVHKARDDPWQSQLSKCLCMSMWPCAHQIFSDSCLGMLEVSTVQISEDLVEKWRSTRLNGGF